MTFHIRITEHEVQEGLRVISHIAGNSVFGNAASAISHGIETYNDIENHNVFGAITYGAETVINGSEAVLDGMSGEWL